MNVASIDIGTNTVILLIAEVDHVNKKIIPIYNEQKIPRMGKDLSKGKNISDKKINDLLDCLNNYNEIIKEMNVEKTFVTATNALRIASNGKGILEKIKTIDDFQVEIVSGNDEAKLSFFGAVHDEKTENNYVVIDIGGGSTEIIYGSKKKLSYCKSFSIGVVSGTEKYFKNNPPGKDELSKFTDELNRVFSELESKSFDSENVIAIAGTPTTLAAIKLNLEKYDENKLEGTFLLKKEIDEMINEISIMDSKQIALKYKSVVKGREDVLLAGTVMLSFLMNILKADKVKVSTKGIRHGAIVKHLDLLQHKK